MNVSTVNYLCCAQEEELGGIISVSGGLTQVNTPFNFIVEFVSFVFFYVR